MLRSMVTVHHLGLSQSERIVWLCEELEIPYELVVHARDGVTRLAPPSYKALHPAGTAPVIADGELVLAESGAIIEYLIDRHGGGRFRVAPDAPNFADYLFWFHFANGSMMPNQLLGLVLGVLPDGGGSLGTRMATRRHHNYALVETRLGQMGYFAGNELTAADINMVFTLTTIRRFLPQDLAHFPNVRAYLQRIGARPAYQRAMAKADPGFEPLLQ
ncbi:MAG: glutathione S-transferase [Lysobacterales bacterium]